MCRAALAIALLCLVAGSRQLSLTEFSVPTAVEAGEDAEMRCKYSLNPGENDANLFVKWWMTNITEDRVHLYQRISGLPKAEAVGHHNMLIKDNDTIVIQKMRPVDSGIYECEVSNIDEIREHQALTVFSQGSGPQLNVSEIPDGPDEDQEDDVFVECRAEDVSPKPDIVLTVAGKEYYMAEFVDGPDNENLFDIVGNATFSKRVIDSSEIRCELFFFDTSIKHQPYVDLLVYESGPPTTPEPPQDDPPVEAATDNLTEQQSGDSTLSRISLALLVVGVFAHLPTLT